MRLVLKIASYLLYLLTIVAAYGGRMNPDFFTLPSIMVLLLPYLGILTGLVAIAWLIGRRWIVGALGIATLISCWAPFTTASPLSFSKKSDNPERRFTVMTWNIIHGIDQQYGVERPGNRTFDYIINSGADIVNVQELIKLKHTEVPYFNKSLEDSLRSVYPYIVGSDTLDMKVFSKFPAKYIPATHYIDERFDSRRYTFYKINVKGTWITLINIHHTPYSLTESERKVVTDIRNVQTMKQSVGEMKGDIYSKMRRSYQLRKENTEILVRAIEKIDGPLIVCGDFNDVPESYSYRLMRNCGLKDAYVETGFGPMITYNQHAFWFHLDQIFYRGALKALDVKKGSIKSSDHYPLTATFELL